MSGEERMSGGDRRRLEQVWALVADLQDDDTHHPHNEAFRAAVLRIRKLLKPVFDPSAEDIAGRLGVENEALKERVAALEAQLSRTLEPPRAP